MYTPSIEQLKRALSKKGYPIKKGEWELNIIGIRNENAQPNSFDDTICLLFKDHYGDDTLLTFSCTTDVALFWSAHPTNVEGCIVMKEGHYPNAYKMGVCYGYKALKQVGEIRYVINNKMDGILDYEFTKEVIGNFATPIHYALLSEKKEVAEKWNAGAQVINTGWLEFLEVCDHSVLITEKKTFDYTLLTIKDVQYA
jgi:hypothetical protein